MSAWPKFFEDHSGIGAILPPEPASAKPCGECPSGDMYAEIVTALATQDPALHERVLKRWDCHMQPWRRCRGARDGSAGQA